MINGWFLNVYKLGFSGEEVTETSGTRAWGESIPPTPPEYGDIFWGEVCTSFAREAVNWDLSVGFKLKFEI